MEVQAHSGIPPSAAGSTLSKAIRSTYILGADDQITVHALDAEEISEKPMRIDMSGYIRLPLVGRVLAAGLTVEQLENEIAARLRKYIKEPDVAVSVLEFRSQPISVIGSVKAPGVYQLQGHKTLVECLSVAAASDDAGYSVKITRRLEWGTLPLPSAVTDPTGHFSIAQVKLAEIIAARNPAENILILPEDIISVPRGEMVYVIGKYPELEVLCFTSVRHFPFSRRSPSPEGPITMQLPKKPASCALLVTESASRYRSTSEL